MALRRWLLEPDDAEFSLVGSESFSFFVAGADALSGWDPLNISIRVRCLLLLPWTVELVVVRDLLLAVSPSSCDRVGCVLLCVSMSSRYTTDSS